MQDMHWELLCKLNASFSIPIRGVVVHTLTEKLSNDESKIFQVLYY